jgi:hypothetical protein
MGILDTLAGLPPEQAQGLLATGLGILANNTGHYGAFGPAVGAGGLTGLSNLQSQTALKRKYGLEERQVSILDAYRKQQEAQMQNQLDMMQWAKQHFLSDPALGGQSPAQQSPDQQPAPQQPQGPLPPGTGTVLAPEPQAPASAPASAQAMPQPTAAYDPRIAAARFGMTLGAMKLDPSAILSANEQLYPKGVPIREGGLGDPFTGREIVQPMLKPVAGLAQRRNAQGQYEYYRPVGSELVAQQEADVSGQQEKARELNKFHPVTSASGATTPMWGANIPGAPGVPTAAPTVLPAKPSQGADPWTMMPKLQTPTGIGQSTYQKYSAENTASVAKKLVEDHGQTATAANARIALNNQALSLIDQADTGPYASQIADVKNILVSRFGIPESSFQNTPSATIALQKDLVNAATQKAKQQFGSRITQSEVMLMLKRGAPSVDMTKAAMAYLINSDNAQAQYNLQQSSDLGRYLQQGGDPTRFEAWYAKSFPQSFNDTHLNVGAKAPVKIMGDSDYGKLPSGAEFIDPQGKRRRKP